MSRKYLNQPMRVKTQSLRVTGEFSHFQSNDYTIGKRFTVIKNTFDSHFLCVFRQSSCASTINNHSSTRQSFKFFNLKNNNPTSNFSFLMF